MTQPLGNLELLRTLLEASDCVETRVRWIKKEGYHIEDLVLITDDGPKVLTTYFDAEELFVI